MNRLIFIVFIFLVSFSVRSQNSHSLKEFNLLSATKEDYKSLKNFSQVDKLTSSFGVFQIGDELLIGRPHNHNLLRFSFIAIGEYSLLNAMAMIMLPSLNAKTKIVIENLRIYKPNKKQDAIVIVDFKNIENSNASSLSNFDDNNINPSEMIGNIFNLEKAILTGEILNPNNPQD